MITQYSKVKLKSGEIATIVEVFSNPEVYIADIEKISGTDTDFVYPEQVQEWLD